MNMISSSAQNIYVVSCAAVVLSLEGMLGDGRQYASEPVTHTSSSNRTYTVVQHAVSKII
jgi:hypothetical protein